MRKSKVSRRLGAFVTSTLMTGAIAGSTAQAHELIGFEDLGSGAEVRADLLASPSTGFKSPEAKCGEGKCGDENAETKAAEHKCGEGKCGEGKCGEKSSDQNEMKSGQEKAADAKEAPHGRKKDVNSSTKKSSNDPN